MSALRHDAFESAHSSESGNPAATRNDPRYLAKTASSQAKQLFGRPPRGRAVGAVSGAALRSLIIGLTAFLTVVDLFATQAILPSLTKAYGVTPGAMGVAVNAS